jgi:hypothetical protein
MLAPPFVASLIQTLLLVSNNDAKVILEFDNDVKAVLNDYIDAQYSVYIGYNIVSEPSK